MTRRQSFFAYAALLLSAVLFASSFVRPTVGQQANPAPPVVGRYQIATSGSSAAPNLYVIDTTIGRIWHSNQADQPLNWVELQCPVKSK
jgi:hypothetical protein